MTPSADIRLLLAMAGLLLPPSLRTEWLREWNAEFWHLGPSTIARTKLWSLASGSFRDAWTLLREEYGIGHRIRDTAHSRTGPLIALAVLLVIAALLTNGFERGRQLLSGDDSARLVLIAEPVPFMGGSSRIPAPQIHAWLQTAKTVAEVGRWAATDGICRADATAQRLLSMAPATQCNRIDTVAPEDLLFAGIVAQIDRAYTFEDAAQELNRTVTLREGWMCPRVVSLTALRRESFMPVGLVLLVALLLSLLSVRTRTMEASIWASGRIVCSFALIAGVWIELAARAPFTDIATIPLSWTVLLYVLPVASGGCAAWYFRRHAREHCRICYRPLTMPIALGRSGCCLLEPSGIEYLCSAGHGVLIAVSMIESSADDVWATLSDTWA